MFIKKIKIIILIILILWSLRLYFHNILFLKNLASLKTSDNHLIAIVFGTRAEAVKMIPIIQQLKKKTNFLSVIINTGQHMKLLKQTLISYNMSKFVDINLNIMTKNQTLSDLTSKAILELSKIYSLINPDAIIVQGDTSTSFAAALSGFYLKIPIFHVEAGLRTYNLYSPFPEEFNRIGIDDISDLYFASTSWAAENLVKENKNVSKIFITGNTIVDTLMATLKNTCISPYIKKLLKIAKSRCKNDDNCKIILLTCHRRENYFKPIVNILKAIQKLLNDFNNIIIILPFHLNPNVRQSIKNGLPKEVYNDIINQKEIKNNEYLFLNRLILIQPLNYIDLVHLENSCFFIMTDSGGIQEEAISLGKPVLILRENTERVEGIKLGSSILVGTSPKKIYYYATLLLKNETLYNLMAQPHKVYGKGNSAKIIVYLIERYFENNLPNSIINKPENITKVNFTDIISQFEESTSNGNKLIKYDLIIVLTVWKRNHLESQLIQVKRQSILKNLKTNIIIFQNSNHVNINKVIEKWKETDTFKDYVNITYINSPVETGYFGRFVIPLISSVTNKAYFIICDDDVIWGDRYFENMIRVVDEGYLATRNGRLINKNYESFFPASNNNYNRNIQVCFNEDIEYDFGGHIWAGRMTWLRNAWTHIPLSFENCEDFWLSATLKSFYNISTRSPKCPCPINRPIIPDLCAAEHISAHNHTDAILGNTTVGHSVRNKIIKETSIKYNYKPLIFSQPNIIENINNKFIYGNISTNPLFNLTDSLWKNVQFWQ
jgi:UDP-N-acetylglucosamine 2-epimerase (non-hydrolysing)